MRKPKPDTRPHWNDPDLKMRMTVTYRDGMGNIFRKVEDFTAEQMSENSRKCLQYSEMHPMRKFFAPKWNEDPTYDLKRRKTK